MAPAYAILIAATSLFLQVGSPVVTPPAPVPQSQSQIVNNNTVVFPAPDPAVTAESGRQLAPIALDAGMRGVASNGGGSIGEVFNLGLGLGRIRRDVIETPIVQTLNENLTRVAILSVGMLLAALLAWGMMAQFVGSDLQEAVEFLMRFPLWVLLALTTYRWYGTLLDLFTALGGIIATTSTGTFGETMNRPFWEVPALGLFTLVIGLFYLFNLLIFALQFFSNTAFLALALAVAPVFVLLSSTPWTSRWSKNWFHLVPGTLGDTLAMLTVLAIGGPALALIANRSPFATVALSLGLLGTLPLVRHLFGVQQGHTAGSRLFSTVMLTRAIRGLRNSGGGRAPSPGGSSSTRSPTSPTRAPRYGTAASNKPMPTPRGPRSSRASA